MHHYQDYLNQTARKNLPLFLQLTFLVVGAMLIVAFALLYGNTPIETEATLISPLIQNSANVNRKDYSYALLYGDPKRILLKETAGDNQTIKLIGLGTNLSDTIISGKRVGFVGTIDTTTFLFLEDKEGLGRFVISKYNTVTKETEDFLAFNGPKTLALHQLDQLVSISPDKTRLAITHESGIVIYTLSNQNEVTILENSAEGLNYYQPLWVSNAQLLVYQNTLNTQTPLVVTTNGNISAVLPGNLTDLAISSKGFPLAGVNGDTLFSIESKKTTEVLKAKDTKYRSPVFLGNEIVYFAEESGVPTVAKTDKLGKKVITLGQFSADTVLSDLLADPTHENIFFAATVKTDSNISVTFYKMGIANTKTESFYSISKNL